MKDKKPASYDVIYHKGMKGRAEYLRVTLAAAGVKYHNNTNIEQYFFANKAEKQQGLFPARAVPALKQGQFMLSQTACCQRYIGELHGLAPETLEARFYADSLNQTLHEFLGEARLTHHAKYWWKTSKGQEEFSKPFKKLFWDERVDIYFEYIERCLEYTSGKFLFGDKLSYVDCTLLILHLAMEKEEDSKERYNEKYATLSNYQQLINNIKAHPAIKKYLENDFNEIPFDTDSFM